MRFIYHVQAGSDEVHLKGEEYKYIIKVRRHKLHDIIYLRNEKAPHWLYGYKIGAIEGRVATLNLLSSKEQTIKPSTLLHVGWCLIDFNAIDKVLAQLNEIGVSKITFIKCDRSQKNFKLDYKRMWRVLRSSNMQCGRSEMMQLQEIDTLKMFIDSHPNTVVLDFCDTPFDINEDIATVLIGCEGGFSESERELFNATCRVRRFNSPLVLRSESAVVAVASKLLL